MGNAKLYKYLDYDGCKKMFQYSNLQFTNATRLNDPFDCHPGLIDFSNVPDDKKKMWGKELSAMLASNKYERLRNDVWICSMSKVNDSILMWSYYGNHKGVCVGIDMEKAKHYLSKIPCTTTMGAFEIEVQYRDIIEKPDYFRHAQDLYRYQLSTKAKAWEHEQEVRLVLFNPSPNVVALPYIPKKRDEPIDWKEVRAYPQIGGECFDSLYLGINIDKKQKKEIIEIAKKRNPEIKIYQMVPDPDAFRIIELLLD